ncbi:MAG: hypothetical protein AAF745_13935, partial [Planctomycetota bacterium]
RVLSESSNRSASWQSPTPIGDVTATADEQDRIDDLNRDTDQPLVEDAMDQPIAEAGTTSQAS